MELCEPTRIDETLHELNEHGSEQFPFAYFRSFYQGEDNHFPWHWHQDVEIVLVESGEAHCMIGNERIVLRRGEGLFIQAGVIHSYETPYRVVMPTVLFRPSLVASETSVIYNRLVEPFLKANYSHVSLLPDVPWQNEILNTVRKIGQLIAAEEPTMELDIHAAVCGLWANLWRHQAEISTLGKTESSTLIQVRLRKMIRFIEANFAGKIRLEEIARAASVSVSEALRCFREGVHTTPVDYLNQYRLNNARWRLVSTTLSVTEIAIESGFSSAAYLDRLFQHHFGASPTEYRKRYSAHENKVG